MTNNLRDLRTAGPLTVTAVASLMGVSQPYISTLERSSRVPGDYVLARYLTALGLDDRAAQLLDRLTADQLAEVTAVRKRLDDFATTLPPFYRDQLRPGAVGGA